MIGIHEYLRRLSGDRLVTQTREALAGRLMELYGRAAQPDWPWFEEELTYDNAKLLAGTAHQSRRERARRLCAQRNVEHTLSL